MSARGFDNVTFVEWSAHNDIAANRTERGLEVGVQVRVLSLTQAKALNF